MYNTAPVMVLYIVLLVSFSIATTLPFRFCGVSSALQLQHDFLCHFLGTSGECAQNLQNLHETRQMTATTTRITEGVKTEVERHRKTRSSAAGDQDHQLQCITDLVNEQESQ